MSSNTVRYRSARDQLVEVLADPKAYDAAVARFEWPDVTGTWNWATDCFDVIAADPATGRRLALWIVEED